MVLLRRYKVRKAGLRGYIIALPNEYLEDANVRAGQKLSMYRDGDNLVLVPDPPAAKDDSPQQSISQKPT